MHQSHGRLMVLAASILQFQVNYTSLGLYPITEPYVWPFFYRIDACLLEDSKSNIVPIPIVSWAWLRPVNLPEILFNHFIQINWNELNKYLMAFGHHGSHLEYDDSEGLHLQRLENGYSWRYVQIRPKSSEYGGARTSRTAQEDTEVKQCMFPPLWGYKMEVWHGAVRTSSVCNLASLAVYQEYNNRSVTNYIFYTRSG